MKRMTLIAIALCLVMLTTVGAGVVAAKQTENPRHAGASSIYLYDVAATDSHGAGKLQINVDKHTFVFNGKDFTPSAMIELKAKAADSAEYKVFATGKATPSGNLHIAGTWDKDTTPTAVSCTFWQLTGFELHNTGWFVAQLACKYSTDGGATWTETSAIKGIAKGQSAHVDYLSDLGVPDRALVKIHAIVVGGKDRTGSEVWTYIDDYGSTTHWEYHELTYLAEYKISGVTWNPTLVYVE